MSKARNLSKLKPDSSGLIESDDLTSAITINTLTSGTVDINGGAIDGTTIGATTASTGAFTNLTASGTLGVTGAGTIQGLTVGRGAGAEYSNTAVGASTLLNNSSGNQNTGLGTQTLLATTSGFDNTAIGYFALRLTATGGNNTAVGSQALTSNTASNNTAVGYQAGYSNTTGAGATAVGYKALYANNQGTNAAFGDRALTANTDGYYNTAIGNASAISTTTGLSNTSVGYVSLQVNTTGSYNTAIGNAALNQNTTASYNTAVGYQAGYTNQTGTQNLFLGYGAGYTNNSNYNVFIGMETGKFSTGTLNCFVGYNSGYNMTTGTKNTILGNYAGNQGGLDIRTSSNNIVLSDGDGTPQFIVNGISQAGLFGIPLSTWDSARYRSLQFGNGTAARYFSITQQFTAACSGSLLWNAYGDGDNTFKYTVTGDKAGRLSIASDNFAFYGAGTGTANNVISWSTILGGQKDYTVNLQGATSTAGTGIAFPATQNASSNANTLDDYEEGTWTPTLAFGGDSVGVTYATQGGTYTKIGRTVYFSARITLTSKGSSTGYAQFRGLPFAVLTSGNNGGYANATLSYSTNTNGFNLTWQFTMDEAQTYIFLRYNNGSNSLNGTDSLFNNNTDVILTGTYQTNT